MAADKQPSQAPTGSTPSAPVNIPLGNSAVTPDSDDRTRDETSTGNRYKDIQAAVSRINVRNDLEHIGEIPCARNSLLSGIAGGAGLGAVRYLASRRVFSAANWAVGTFTIVSLARWEMCRRARAKELAQMRLIQERFPHRHASNLKRLPESGSSPTNGSSGSSQSS